MGPGSKMEIHWIVHAEPTLYLFEDDVQELDERKAFDTIPLKAMTYSELHKLFSSFFPKIEKKAGSDPAPPVAKPEPAKAPSKPALALGGMPVGKMPKWLAKTFDAANRMGFQNLPKGALEGKHAAAPAVDDAKEEVEAPVVPEKPGGKKKKLNVPKSFHNEIAHAIAMNDAKSTYEALTDIHGEDHELAKRLYDRALSLASAVHKTSNAKLRPYGLTVEAPIIGVAMFGFLCMYLSVVRKGIRQSSAKSGKTRPRAGPAAGRVVRTAELDEVERGQPRREPLEI